MTLTTQPGNKLAWQEEKLSNVSGSRIRNAELSLHSFIHLFSPYRYQLACENSSLDKFMQSDKPESHIFDQWEVT